MRPGVDDGNQINHMLISILYFLVAAKCKVKGQYVRYIRTAHNKWAVIKLEDEQMKAKYRPKIEEKPESNEDNNNKKGIWTNIRNKVKEGQRS